MAAHINKDIKTTLLRLKHNAKCTKYKHVLRKYVVKPHSDDRCQTWKEHISESSTLIIAPALSNCPQ